MYDIMYIELVLLKTAAAACSKLPPHRRRRPRAPGCVFTRPIVLRHYPSAFFATDCRPPLTLQRYNTSSAAAVFACFIALSSELRRRL